MWENDGKTIAIVPAKRNSRAITYKNLALLGNRPLLDWTLSELKKAKLVDEIIVSTNGARIREFVKNNYPNVSVYDRPVELTCDAVQVEMVIWFTILTYMKWSNTIPDKIVVLQPTSPFRTAEDIDTAIEYFPIFMKDRSSVRGADARSLFSVSSLGSFAYRTSGVIAEPVSHTPGTRLGRESYDTDDMLITENGAIYIATAKDILEHKTFRIEPMVPFLMRDIASIEIDSPMDLSLAELIVKEELHTLERTIVT